MRLQSRITLTVLLPVLACLGLFGSVAYVKVKASLIEASVQSLGAIADVKVAQVERLVASYRAVSISAAARLAHSVEALGSPGPEWAEALSTELTTMMAENTDIAGMHLIDPDGLGLASSNPAFIGSYADDRLGPFDSAYVSDQGARVRPFLLDAGGEPRTVVLAPVMVDGRYLGALGVRFAANSLSVAVETGAFGRTGELLLAMRDDDGNARFLTPVRQDPDAAGEILAGPNETNVPMIRALMGENAAHKSGFRDYAGNSVIAVTRYLPSMDWGLVAGIDTEEAIEPVAELGTVLLVMAAVLSFLAILVSRYFGGELNSAVSALQRELEARTAAERRFRRLLATSPTAGLAAEAFGADNALRITLANREAARLLGYEIATLQTMTLRQILPESGLKALAELQDAYEAGDPDVRSGARADMVLVNEAGVEIPVEVALTPLAMEHRAVVVLSIVDLTDRKAAETALAERAEALSRSNQDLDDFAHVASHDLKAPLRAISQLAMFIEEDVGDALPEDSRADLALLRGRVARLDRLLDGLLEYSRVGRKESESRWINTRALLDDVAELYVPAERFRLEVQDDLPAVHAPRTAVEIVFRNLLMNSVKHHDAEVGTIRVLGHADATHVHFVVEDDGPGIPLNYANKVFQLFQTLHPRDEVEGSGMGLALVRKALESCGGSIELRPGRGRGASFHFRWPIRAARTSTQDAA